MAVLALHHDAIEDLEQIRRMRPGTAALIEVALQEIEADPSLAYNLTDHGYGEEREASYGISRWHRLWKGGRDIWRLKSWSLEDAGLRYRIIYAYLPTQLAFYILAIAHRSALNYDDPNDHLAQRILTAYEDL